MNCISSKEALWTIPTVSLFFKYILNFINLSQFPSYHYVNETTRPTTKILSVKVWNNPITH